MPVSMEPEVDEPAPPDGLSEGGGGDDGDPEQPWWHQPWKLLVLGVYKHFKIINFTSY